MMKVALTCEMCGKEFVRDHYFVHDHNFCSRPCLNAWNSKRIHDLNLNVTNVKGHNLGHSAPHLSEWNKRRAVMNRSEHLRLHAALARKRMKERR